MRFLSYFYIIEDLSYERNRIKTNEINVQND